MQEDPHLDEFQQVVPGDDDPFIGAFDDSTTTTVVVNKGLNREATCMDESIEEELLKEATKHSGGQQKVFPEGTKGPPQGRSSGLVEPLKRCLGVPSSSSSSGSPKGSSSSTSPPSASSSSLSTKFKLAAVVSHLGSDYSTGHYIADVSRYSEE